MEPIQIIMYKTSDGKMFEKQSDAEYWQDILDDPAKQICEKCAGSGTESHSGVLPSLGGSISFMGIRPCSVCQGKKYQKTPALQQLAALFDQKDKLFTDGSTQIEGLKSSEPTSSYMAGQAAAFREAATLTRMLLQHQPDDADH